MHRRELLGIVVWIISGATLPIANAQSSKNVQSNLLAPRVFSNLEVALQRYVKYCDGKPTVRFVDISLKDAPGEKWYMQFDKLEVDGKSLRYSKRCPSTAELLNNPGAEACTEYENVNLGGNSAFRQNYPNRSRMGKWEDGSKYSVNLIAEKKDGRIGYAARMTHSGSDFIFYVYPSSDWLCLAD